MARLYSKDNSGSKVYSNSTILSLIFKEQCIVKKSIFSNSNSTPNSNSILY